MSKVIIVILLVCILAVNVFVAYKVIKHYEIFSNDPLVYGAQVHDVNTCFCTRTDGESFRFNQEAVTYTLTQKPKEYEINIGEE